MKTLLLLILSLGPLIYASSDPDLYVKALKEKDQEPVQFVLAKLDTFDLLIFDDALHNAAEPFKFYQDLIADSGFIQKAKYIFVEVFSIDQQRYIDQYLAISPEDTMVLLPVFQNDYSGTGWNAQTYLDLLRSLYRINHALPKEKHLEVIAVSNPFYWDCIHSQEDLEIARKSLAGRDYFMYKIICDHLRAFWCRRKRYFSDQHPACIQRYQKQKRTVLLEHGHFLQSVVSGKNIQYSFSQCKSEHHRGGAHGFSRIQNHSGDGTYALQLGLEWRTGSGIARSEHTGINPLSFP